MRVWNRINIYHSCQNKKYLYYKLYKYIAFTQIFMKQKEKIQRLREYTSQLFPDATTELYFNNEYQLLIAILMSAQVTDIQVNKVNSVFFQSLKKPKDAIKLWIPKIAEYIKTLSFYKNKSRFIFETSEILIEKYNSQIPKTLEELTALPWVWIKTAKVFLWIIENAPYLWVDTHVHRVLNRTWIVKTKDALETDKKAEKVFTKDDLAFLHNTLIFFGRYHCIARKPKCDSCELKDFCKYYRLKEKK